MLEDAIKRQSNLGRYLCHIYQRMEQGDLSLITGAGISMDVGVPGWMELVDRLAEEPSDLAQDIKHLKQKGLSLEYLGQILYHRLKSGIEDEIEDKDSQERREAHLRNKWATSIQKAIYRDVPRYYDEILQKHPYLSEIRDFSRKLSLIINFNFDDILDESIGHQIKQSRHDETRQFTVVWNPPLVERAKTTTIYHVNGVLPRGMLRKRSPQLIFTENSFEDAMQRSPGVSNEYISLRFVQNTVLIVGHSLSDRSLKNYLRRSREKAPANHHYMIYWISECGAFTTEQRRDIFDANLELYNLITIFLTSCEINQFFQILNSESRDFRDTIDKMEPDQRHRFHYYIAGPVAVGKSSMIEHLRCFNTFEEWNRPPPEEMFRNHKTLTEEESKLVNDFVYGELKEKNIKMCNAGVGFHFMDRAPLDLYAFSSDGSENIKKTQELEDRVTRDKAFQSGEIVFLEAKGDTLVTRNLGRGREPGTAGSAEHFEKQSTKIKLTYDPSFVLSTEQVDPGHLAQRVARRALMGPYEVVDLSAIMDRHKMRGGRPKLTEKQQMELHKMHQAGKHSISELAEFFSVSSATVNRALRRIRNSR